ncbi:hypothetical protein INH39_19820 [Massilia violaceinigra]|uniref:Uncharacterized protein n=1 Tax=Massilia violaceinigra TaxID=2045208 RepID=A0ABY4ALK0_9BURK|nr:hypothetical protein INH39_19820 [Massilia violaceinigra]
MTSRTDSMGRVSKGTYDTFNRLITSSTDWGSRRR